MKIRNIFYIGLLFLISTLGYAQQIYRAGNGVTIIAAPTAQTGIEYLLDGTLYMVVDNATVDAQVNAGNYNTNNDGRTLAQTIDLDADDYVEVYVKCNTTVNSPDLINGSFFGAYKIIE